MRRFNGRHPFIHPSSSLYCIVATVEGGIYSLYPIPLHNTNQPLHNTITSIPSQQTTPHLGFTSRIDSTHQYQSPAFPDPITRIPAQATPRPWLHPFTDQSRPPLPHPPITIHNPHHSTTLFPSASPAPSSVPLRFSRSPSYTDLINILA
jgi:hypothetical protein